MDDRIHDSAAPVFGRLELDRTLPLAGTEAVVRFRRVVFVRDGEDCVLLDRRRTAGRQDPLPESDFVRATV